MPPFTYAPFVNPFVGSIGQMLEHSGDPAAAAAHVIGQTVAAIPEQIQQQQRTALVDKAQQRQLAEAEREDLDKSRARSVQSAMDIVLKGALVKDPATGLTTYDRDKLQAGMTEVGVPQTALAQYLPVLDASDKAITQAKALHVEALKHSAQLVDMAGNDPVVFKAEIQRGIANGLFTPQDAQPYLAAAEKDPTHIGRITAAMLGRDPHAGEFTLNPGDARYGPDGRPIATNPKPPETPSMQSKDVLLDGQPALVSFNPKTGTYHDASGADVTARVRPIPPASTSAAGGSAYDVRLAVQGMKDGTNPPLLPGRASKEYIATMAEAKRQGYDLANAATDWVATQKHIATMNGSQQLRLNQSIGALPEMLDSVDALASKWKAGRFPALNRATLIAAKGGALGQEAATIATQLDAQIADVTADLGNVYMGGNSPTDHALSLAGKSLSGDWSEGVLHDMVALARKNVTIRQNSIRNAGVAGASDTNPYGSQPPSPRATTAPPAEGTEGAVNGVPAVWKNGPQGPGWYAK